MVNTPYEKDTDLSHTLHGQPPKAALRPWLPWKGSCRPQAT